MYVWVEERKWCLVVAGHDLLLLSLLFMILRLFEKLFCVCVWVCVASDLSFVITSFSMYTYVCRSYHIHIAHPQFVSIISYLIMKRRRLW